MEFPLDSYGISMGFLWAFHDISCRCLWYFYGVTKGSLLDSIMISMGFPWWFFGTSLGFQRVWDSKGVSMDLYQISMGSLW